MTALGEIEQRILSELEEAWENNVCSLMNTVYDPSSSADLTEFCDASRSLYERGLVRVTMDMPGRSLELPESEERALLRSLESWFGALDEDGQWGYGEEHSAVDAPVPQLLATEEGHELAFQLLERRGYQWWTHGD
ncbi:hypothetical protein [Nitratireductor sp. ZSWI3]|uniref:hypothetical protein n=1 Tax=Nitratireductor sp. ZSWI3 TaxID=2966359 RepID=UPI0021503A39|nr:hypothetical protein [Nitratireductor sp. ZSWI3]MCR4265347.1 hypothetical protein [Nitratireductor sp. ZSWI3]